MKEVIRVQLSLIDELVVYNEIPLIENEQEVYETVSMFKGFHSINGKRVKRRIYKRNIDKVMSFCDISNIVQLIDCTVCYIDVLKENREEAKKKLIEYYNNLSETALNIAYKFINNKPSIQIG